LKEAPVAIYLFPKKRRDGVSRKKDTAKAKKENDV
jgi:hypothetical protein